LAMLWFTGYEYNYLYHRCIDIVRQMQVVPNIHLTNPALSTGVSRVIPMFCTGITRALRGLSLGLVRWIRYLALETVLICRGFDRKKAEEA